MTKHIIFMSLFQLILLFVFLVGGEYIIPEPETQLRYTQYRSLVGMEENDKVFPGRLYKINGDELY